LLVGIVFTGIAAWKKYKRSEISWASLLTTELAWLGWFALLFGLMMTFGEKKSPRYILPAFPGLVFMAAWGWLTVLQRVNQWFVIGAIGLLALLSTLPYAPYYFTYYNPLLGGAYTAPRLVRIGWGEGLDQAGRWLNAQTGAGAGHLGARYTATLYPFYAGNISSPISEELDYVTFYIKQTQSGYPEPEILAYFEAQRPLRRVTLNRIEYAQIYRGPAMQPIPAKSDTQLPLAFRPHTIYAPIGEQFSVDLLWRNQPVGKTVMLTVQGDDESITFDSQAGITEIAPGARVSTHRFDLPDDLPRAMYKLLVDEQQIGQVKGRLLAIPPEYEPLAVEMAGQLKLAGIRRRVENGQLLLDLAWQAWPAASNDYTVFVQLLDENEQRATGVDVSPQRGFTTLDRKEVMLTHYTLSLPPDLSPGNYKLLVGLYYFAGDELINVGAGVIEPPISLE